MTTAERAMLFVCLLLVGILVVFAASNYMHDHEDNRTAVQKACDEDPVEFDWACAVASYQQAGS